jgi:hypothetical protein
MPVWKYRSVEEMPEAWMMDRDVPLGRRIRAVLSLAPLAGPIGMPRGVHKFRSMDDLAADRAKYERARIARLRAERERK